MCGKRQGASRCVSPVPTHPPCTSYSTPPVVRQHPTALQPSCTQHMPPTITAATACAAADAAAADVAFTAALCAELRRALAPSELIFVSISLEHAASDRESDEGGGENHGENAVSVLAVYTQPVLAALEAPLLAGFRKATGQHWSQKHGQKSSPTSGLDFASVVAGESAAAPPPHSVLSSLPVLLSIPISRPSLSLWQSTACRDVLPGGAATSHARGATQAGTSGSTPRKPGSLA